MPMKKRLDTSNERSLLGTSLAAETSFQQFFWNQRFKPGFLESVEAADTSGSPPFGRSLASLTQHPKWAGEIAINCFQIRSLARSSQRVVSGKCLRHESKWAGGRLYERADYCAAFSSAAAAPWICSPAFSSTLPTR